MRAEAPSGRHPHRSDADGSWSATYRIREDDPLGTYTLRTTCYDPPPPTAITDIQTQAQPATPVVADPDYTG